MWVAHSPYLSIHTVISVCTVHANRLLTTDVTKEKMVFELCQKMPECMPSIVSRLFEGRRKGLHGTHCLHMCRLSVKVSVKVYVKIFSNAWISILMLMLMIDCDHFMTFNIIGSICRMVHMFLILKIM